jgi:hypothetical protein
MEILPLILIPSVVAEATKVFFAPYRRRKSA